MYLYRSYNKTETSWLLSWLLSVIKHSVVYRLDDEVTYNSSITSLFKCEGSNMTTDFENKNTSFL